jgi:predicted transposase/invertase (TIGR01784 family)
MKNLFNHRRSNKEPQRPAGEKAAKSEILNIMDDTVFKAMLTAETEESYEALRSLLSACTRRPVSHVQVTNSELLPAYPGGKKPHLDIHVLFNDGEAADLEMQVKITDDDLKARAELYTAMLISRQARKGQMYKNVKRVYQIFFLNCVLFPESRKMPQRFSYREETEHYQLNDRSEIVFYELPKLEQRVQDITGRIVNVKTKDLPEEEKWCIFMRYQHEERAAELIQKLYREEEGIMWAQEAVNGIDRDYLESIREMSEIKAQWDLELELDTAKKEGRKKGMEEGKAEGQTEKALEVAQKMKTMGLPIAQVAEATGLSLETVENLK